MELICKHCFPDTYKLLWQAIIRPQRTLYSVAELGPPAFRLNGCSDRFERVDLQLENSRGEHLQCSHYRPEVNDAKCPCVVYLHCNCGSRPEALDVMRFLLPRGISLFCFDFAGCGLSEGEYISLGFYEHQDLQVVLSHLRGCDSVGAIALWGRSMGAATTVFGAAETPGLAACIVDSPFSSLRLLAEELVNKGDIPLPRFLLDMALEMVRKEVYARAKFDIEDLAPIEAAPSATPAALFAVATDDEFVKPQHTFELCKAWGSDADVVTFTGGHNGIRPRWFFEKAVAFLMHHLNFSPQVRIETLFLTSTSCGSKAVTRHRKGSSGCDLPDILKDLDLRGAQTLIMSEGDIENKLCIMGFNPHIAAAAAKRHSIIETALEWVLEESARPLKSVDLHAPSSLLNAGEMFVLEDSAVRKEVCRDQKFNALDAELASEVENHYEVDGPTARLG